MAVFEYQDRANADKYLDALCNAGAKAEIKKEDEMSPQAKQFLRNLQKMEEYIQQQVQ